MGAKYFRPQVRRQLQRPLEICAFKLRRPIRDVVSEAVRSFCTMILEENYGNNDLFSSATIEKVLGMLKKEEPIFLDD